MATGIRYQGAAEEEIEMGRGARKGPVNPGPQNASGTRACPDLGAESATRDTARRLGEWLHPSIKALQVKS